ncbi:hypothetical protein TIFTF001_032391 [Ficus carica]|uniref:Secreted protein n=1 Tax=Ficus carica TaxID=3494 RepID=A0AA88DXD2_FICCA|nr:hypothetical protein TIFTF001_032391 [Ficus carica]
MFTNLLFLPTGVHVLLSVVLLPVLRGGGRVDLAELALCSDDGVDGCGYERARSLVIASQTRWLQQRWTDRLLRW